MEMFSSRVYFFIFHYILNVAVYFAHAARCPVTDCRASKRSSLSFLQEPSTPLQYSVAPRKVAKVAEKDEDGKPLYNLEWKPGKFQCSRCDQSSCKNCSVACDLSSCVAEFFQTECWCRKDVDLKLNRPMWRFRRHDGQFALDPSSVKRLFCDPECNGGVCDSDGLTCKKRDEGCRPWWWCNNDPPEKNLDGDGWGDGSAYATSFIQTLSTRATSFIQATHRTLFGKSEAAKESQELALSNESAVESRNSLISKSLTTSLISSSKKKKVEFVQNDIGSYTFDPGQWNCDAASLPPQFQDPKTFTWQDRGYIVLNADSCDASSGKFETKCFCRENKVGGLESESTCDSSCSFGDCEADGRTCQSGPFTAPPPALPTPVDPIKLEKDLKDTVRPPESAEPEEVPEGRDDDVE